MSVENQGASDRVVSPGNSPPAPRRSFGRLALRISAWTTKGLLSAIILVAGLGFGRQVLHWWAADRQPPQAAPAAALADNRLGDPTQPHVFQFGNQPWSLRQQAIAGDRAAAVAALLGDCRRLLELAPPAASRGPKGRAATAADRELLAALKTLKPAAEQPGNWRLYDLPGNFPMVVGVRPGVGQGNRAISAPRKSGQPPGPKPGQSPSASIPANAEVQLAETTPGVVIWGLAIPLGPKAWTLYTFQPDADASRPDSGPADIPLPPGSGRIVSIRVAGGGAITAFSGPDRPGQWREFYDGWFGRHGWKAAGAWQQRGSSWRMRYRSLDPRQPAVADVRFGSDGRGQSTGVFLTSPGAP